MWDLSCQDWESRLEEGKSLVPDLPLDFTQGDRAVAIFNKLRLADVEGTPSLAEAGGDWFRDIVRALFGSLDPVKRARAIRELFLLVPKKNSKALCLKTMVATPFGFSTIEDLRVGDQVIAADGTPTVVMCKSEVFTWRKCFEVEFSTGEKVVCDAEHLWVTDAHIERGRQKTGRVNKVDNRKQPAPRAKSTQEIADTLRVKSGKILVNNHRTSLCGPLDLPDAQLPIHPYVLGAWLGDGGKDSAVITAGREDCDRMVAQIASCGQSVKIVGYDKRTGAARISLAAENKKADTYRFLTAAKALGVHGNKHIPRIYLRGSRWQRLSLLQGLMDTDGTISKAGQASYTTTCERLKDGVVELLASMGLKPSVHQGTAKLYGKDCGPFWLIQFWPFDDIAVFTMPRKLARQKPNQGSYAPRSKTRQIVAVREVTSVPTQCIGVLHHSHQFLVTPSMIPTHNTTNGALLMLTALLLNTRPNASLIMTAPVRDVAQLAFDAAAGAVELDDVLKAKLRVIEHRKTIVHRDTGAELEIMSFDPAALTGQKPVAVLIDELHVVAKMPKAPSAIRQLRGGMLPFPEAFMAFITTQSEEEPAGVFKDELHKARAIRDGKQRGAMLPVLYEFPDRIQKGEGMPWKDPALWPMVTPNVGRSITIDRLIEDMQTAETTGEAELRAWASQHLNIQIGLALKTGAWAGAPLWLDAAESGLCLSDLLERSEVVVAGIDGGGLDDMLAVAVMGREKETGRWLLWAHAWIHPIALARRKSEETRFHDFEREGDLTIVAEKGEDIRGVADIVDQCEESGLLDRIGVDQSGIGMIVEEIESRGIKADRIVGIPQGWKMVSAIKTLERKLADDEIVHSGSGLMSYSVGNAKAEPKGNAVIITKQVSGSAKIDPLLATLNCVTLMALNPAAKNRGIKMFMV